MNAYQRPVQIAQDEDKVKQHPRREKQKIAFDLILKIIGGLM